MPELKPSPEVRAADAHPVAGRTPERRTARRTRTPLLVRRKLAARLCSVGLATWDRWTAAGLNPKSVKIGGAVFWSAAELSAWCRFGCPPRSAWCPMWESLKRV